jgi:hypothetical protein
MQGAGTQWHSNGCVEYAGEFYWGFPVGGECCVYWENGCIRYKGPIGKIDLEAWGRDPSTVGGVYGGYGASWHKNGNLEFEGEFVGGVPHGEGCTVYHDNGKIKYRGGIEGGRYEGQGSLYNRRGVKEYGGEFSYGAPIVVKSKGPKPRPEPSYESRQTDNRGGLRSSSISTVEKLATVSKETTSKGRTTVVVQKSNYTTKIQDFSSREEPAPQAAKMPKKNRFIPEFDFTEPDDDSTFYKTKIRFDLPRERKISEERNTDKISGYESGLISNYPGSVDKRDATRRSPSKDNFASIDVGVKSVDKFSFTKVPEFSVQEQNLDKPLATAKGGPAGKPIPGKNPNNAGRQYASVKAVAGKLAQASQTRSVQARK